VIGQRFARIPDLHRLACERVFANLTPFDTNWEKGSGATPLTAQDLFFGDAISIPTAPTNVF
jgi:hypothetical protein